VIPGGKAGLYLVCALPLIIAALALLINGTDYFIIGLIATATGPVAYIIFKIIYGGAYINEPSKYPLNPVTRLASGDMTRLSAYCLISGAFALFGSLFLAWYEKDWGTDYYLETYGDGFFSDFSGMLLTLKITGIVVLIASLVLWLLAKKVEAK
jgi:hypothetical protein